MCAHHYAGHMAAGGQLVQIDGRRLRVTNLDKVVYPETGTTKGEVIGYYSRIAPLMLPHLRGRPVTRKRWVEGVGTTDAPASAFFTKQLSSRAHPSGSRGCRSHLRRHEGVSARRGRADTLVWMAQVAALGACAAWRFAPDGERGRPDAAWCSISTQGREPVWPNAPRRWPDGRADPHRHGPGSGAGDQRQQGHPPVHPAPHGCRRSGPELKYVR